MTRNTLDTAISWRFGYDRRWEIGRFWFPVGVVAGDVVGSVAVVVVVSTTASNADVAAAVDTVTHNTGGTPHTSYTTTPVVGVGVS